MGPTTKNHYQILLALVAGLVAFGLMLKQDWLLYSALGFALVAALSPLATKYIAWFWTKLGEGLGWVNSKIVLSVIFFLFLVPFGFLYQLTRKNALFLKNPSDSLFKDRNHRFEAKDIKDTW